MSLGLNLFTQQVIYHDPVEIKSHVYDIEEDDNLENVFWKMASMQADIWAFFFRNEASSLKAIKALSQMSSYERNVGDGGEVTIQQHQSFANKLTKYAVAKLKEMGECTVSLTEQDRSLSSIFQSASRNDPPTFCRFPRYAKTCVNYYPDEEALSLVVDLAGITSLPSL